MARRIAVGIIGVGRLGQAVARRLPQDINLLLADKKTNLAKKLAIELSAKAKKVVEIFSKSEVVLLIVPPSDICPLVRKYNKVIKPGAVLVNMATSVMTDKVQKEVQRKDIKIVSAKVIGQAYAISRGDKAVFILSKKDPFVIKILKRLFGSIGNVVVSDERLVEKINAKATHFGLRLVLGLRKQLKKICHSEEIIDVAIKTVAAGTIRDYHPGKHNDYIIDRLKELSCKTEVYYQGTKIDECRKGGRD